ncbi:MAG: rod shape-determining protein MreD [Fibrobacterales bacterium]
MKTAIVIIFALGVLILQSTLLELLSINDVKPDLTIIFLVYISLLFGPVAGVFTGFLLGIIQDIYSYEFLGAHALIKSAIGYFVGLFEEELISLDYITKVIILVFVFFLHDISYGFLIDMKFDEVIEFVKNKSLWESIYTIILGAFIFYLTHTNKKTHV